MKLSFLASNQKQKLIKFQIIKRNKADALFIAQPENVCWTLNIRGEDLNILPS